MTAKIFLFGSRLPQPAFLHEKLQQSAAARLPESARMLSVPPRRRPQFRYVVLPSVIYLPYVPLR